MRWLADLVNGCPVNLTAAEDEVTRRRASAMHALGERRKREPGFTVRPETILGATADDETRRMMRKLAGVSDD